jgi:translation initiation factor 5B
LRLAREAAEQEAALEKARLEELERRESEDHKRKEEERARKKQKEKERIEQLKKEGKYLTKAQKDEKARNERVLQQMKAQGLQFGPSETAEEKKKKVDSKQRRKKNDQKVVSIPYGSLECYLY